MTYLIVGADKSVRYPFTFAQLRAEHPQVSFPREPTEAVLAEFGMFAVADVVKPQPSDPLAVRVIEGAPAFVNNTWVQKWIEEPIAVEEIAKQARVTLDVSYREIVKGDSFVTTFLEMTPAEAVAYIDANVTNIASAKVVLGKFAKMLLLMARRELR